MIENLTYTEYDALLRLDFATFAARCFYDLNPQTELAMNWHLEVIATRLAAVRAGKIRRLIINKPYSTEIIQCIFHPAALGRPIASLDCTGWNVTQCCGQTTRTRRYPLGEPAPRAAQEI